MSFMPLFSGWYPCVPYAFVALPSRALAARLSRIPAGLLCPCYMHRLDAESQFLFSVVLNPRISLLLSALVHKYGNVSTTPQETTG